MKYALASMMLIATATIGGSGAVNNPAILFDEFGTGTQGIPPSYGYGSFQGGGPGYYGGGQYGAGGAGAYEYRYGRGNAAVDFGPGVAPTTGPFHYRPDLWLNDAKRMSEDAQDAATEARRLHSDLSEDISRHYQLPRAIAEYNQGLAAIDNQFRDPTDNLLTQARQVIRNQCADCHLGGNQDGDVALDDYLTPGAPDVSLQEDVVWSVERPDKPGSRRMPKGRSPLSSSQIGILKALLEQTKQSGTIEPDDDPSTGGSIDPPANKPDDEPVDDGVDNVADNSRLELIENRLGAVEDKLDAIGERLEGPPTVATGVRYYRIRKRR